MNDSISPEEQKVAISFGLTNQIYLTKRQFFCRRMSIPWEQLVALSAEDIAVINNTMTDPEVFLSNKLTGLAQTVITS